MKTQEFTYRKLAQIKETLLLAIILSLIVFAPNFSWASLSDFLVCLSILSCLLFFIQSFPLLNEQYVLNEEGIQIVKKIGVSKRIAFSQIKRIIIRIEEDPSRARKQRKLTISQGVEKTKIVLDHLQQAEELLIILEKKASIHSFKVIYQNEQGKIEKQLM